MFVSTPVTGGDGAVRALFTNRAGGATVASVTFRGVDQVAISPRRFNDADAAESWLRQRAQPGGTAVGVQTGHDAWLVGAWIAE